MQRRGKRPGKRRREGRRGGAVATQIVLVGGDDGGEGGVSMEYMINGKNKARYDTCDIFRGGRYVRASTSTSTADSNCNWLSPTLPHPLPRARCHHGPQTQTPRAKAPQESRLSRRPSPSDPRETPLTSDSGSRMPTYARSRSSAGTTFSTATTTTSQSPPHALPPAHLPQIQQALRRPPLVCTPPRHAPRTGPLPRPDGGPPPLQALRHRRPHLTREAQRRRQQAHRRRLLPPSPRRVHVHEQDGRDSQCSTYSPRAPLCHAHTPPQAAKFIEQGHVRVGPDTITDPAFLVTRHVFFPASHTPLIRSLDIWRTLSPG